MIKNSTYSNNDHLDANPNIYKNIASGSLSPSSFLQTNTQIPQPILRFRSKNYKNLDPIKRNSNPRRPMIPVPIPQTKVHKPKLFPAGSKTQLANSICSSTSFVTSITSSLVQPTNTAYDNYASLSSSSTTSTNSDTSHLSKKDCFNTHISNPTEASASSSISSKLLSSVNSFRDFRKSIKSIVDSNVNNINNTGSRSGFQLKPEQIISNNRNNMQLASPPKTSYSKIPTISSIVPESNKQRKEKSIKCFPVMCTSDGLAKFRDDEFYYSNSSTNYQNGYLSATTKANDSNIDHKLVKNAKSNDSKVLLNTNEIKQKRVETNLSKTKKSESTNHLPLIKKNNKKSKKENNDPKKRFSHSTFDINISNTTTNTNTIKKNAKLNSSRISISNLLNKSNNQNKQLSNENNIAKAEKKQEINKHLVQEQDILAHNKEDFNNKHNIIIANKKENTQFKAKTNNNYYHYFFTINEKYNTPTTTSNNNSNQSTNNQHKHIFHNPNCKLISGNNSYNLQHNNLNANSSLSLLSTPTNSFVSQTTNNTLASSIALSKLDTTSHNLNSYDNLNLIESSLSSQTSLSASLPYDKKAKMGQKITKFNNLIENHNFNSIVQPNHCVDNNSRPNCSMVTSKSLFNYDNLNANYVVSEEYDEVVNDEINTYDAHKFPSTTFIKNSLSFPISFQLVDNKNTNNLQIKDNENIIEQDNNKQQQQDNYNILLLENNDNDKNANLHDINTNTTSATTTNNNNNSSYLESSTTSSSIENIFISKQFAKTNQTKQHRFSTSSTLSSYLGQAKAFHINNTNLKDDIYSIEPIYSDDSHNSDSNNRLHHFSQDNQIDINKLQVINNKLNESSSSASESSSSGSSILVESPFNSSLQQQANNNHSNSKRSSFKQKLIRINKRWSISKFNKAEDESNSIVNENANIKAKKGYENENTIYDNLNELDEINLKASSTKQQEEIKNSPKSKPKAKKRSNSLTNSSASLLGRSISNLVICKAIVIKESAPSPYDKNSLSLKVGDTIDVIDMNETGIWTGILNKKIGTFKFIHVDIIETIKSHKNSTRSILKLAKKSINNLIESNLKLNKPFLITTTTTKTRNKLFKLRSKSDSYLYKNTKSIVFKLKASNSSPELIILANTLEKTSSSANRLQVAATTKNTSNTSAGSESFLRLSSTSYLFSSSSFSSSSFTSFNNFNSISDYLNLIDPESEDYKYHQAYVNLFRLNNILTCNDLLKLNNDYFINELNITNSNHLEQLNKIKLKLNYFNNNSNKISSNRLFKSKSESDLTSINSKSDSPACKLKQSLDCNENAHLSNTRVKLRKMGQKSSKSSDIIKEFEPNVLITASTTSSSSSSASTTSSKSKSNHDSAISNDSGCYSADNTEKYLGESSPSGSSVLCLFDLTNNSNLDTTNSQITLNTNSTSEQIEAKLNKNKAKKSKNQINKSKTLTKQEILTKTKKSQEKKENNLYLNDLNLDQAIRRSSVCDSTIYSCSLSSLSNSCLNEEDVSLDLKSKSIKPNEYFERETEEDCNKKAQLLCDQLNQILNISTCLASESVSASLMQNEATRQINLNQESNKKSKLIESSNVDYLNKSSQPKTINFSNTINLKNHMSKFINGSIRQTNNSTKTNNMLKSKLINRSHTFHSNHFKYSNENINGECNRNVIKNFLIDSNKNNDEPNEANNSNNNKKSKNNGKKISNYLFKNGRKLFAWNKNAKTQNKYEHTLSNSNSKQFNQLINTTSSNSSSQKTEEQVINLIAAKLLSENIELAKQPYSDQFGFCKIPISLVKRYSCELKQDIQLVSKCLETERLNQLEKSGKLGIPNDFLYTSCKCNSSNAWESCKCGLDTTSIESFFISLGLPMYSETIKNYTNNLNDGMLRLFEMTPQQIEQSCGINNKTHLNVVLKSIQIAKSLIQN